MSASPRSARSTTTRIPSRGLGESQAWEAVRLSLQAEGFRCGAPSTVGVPTSFARSVRPAWVLPAVVLLAVPTAGLALLLLLLRRSETCSVTMEDSYRGITVNLHGPTPAGVVNAVRHAVAGPPSDAGTEQVRDPDSARGVAARRTDDPALAALLPPLPRPPAPLPRPAGPDDRTTVPDDRTTVADQRTTVPDDRTTVVEARTPVVEDRTIVVDERTTVATPATPPVALVTDDGRYIAPGHLAFVGRNPQPPAGAPAGRLVMIEDPGMSMSKTHFATGIFQNRVWVRDLGSTNGTVVLDRTGVPRTLAAQEAVVLEPGDRFQAGDRWFQVQVAAVGIAEETVAGW